MAAALLQSHSVDPAPRGTVDLDAIVATAAGATGTKEEAERKSATRLSRLARVTAVALVPSSGRQARRAGSGVGRRGRQRAKRPRRSGSAAREEAKDGDGGGDDDDEYVAGGGGSDDDDDDNDGDDDDDDDDDDEDYADATAAGGRARRRGRGRRGASAARCPYVVLFSPPMGYSDDSPPPGGLPASSTRVLRRWIVQHWDNPLPTGAGKRALASSARLSERQCDNWLARERKRVWRPLQRIAAYVAHRLLLARGADPGSQGDVQAVTSGDPSLSLPEELRRVSQPSPKAQAADPAGSALRVPDEGAMGPPRPGTDWAASRLSQTLPPSALPPPIDTRAAPRAPMRPGFSVGQLSSGSSVTVDPGSMGSSLGIGSAHSGQHAQMQAAVPHQLHAPGPPAWAGPGPPGSGLAPPPPSAQLHHHQQQQLAWAQHQQRLHYQHALAMRQAHAHHHTAAPSQTPRVDGAAAVPPSRPYPDAADFAPYAPSVAASSFRVPPHGAFGHPGHAYGAPLPAPSHPAAGVWTPHTELTGHTPGHPRMAQALWPGPRASPGFHYGPPPASVAMGWGQGYVPAATTSGGTKSATPWPLPPQDS